MSVDPVLRDMRTRMPWSSVAQKVLTIIDAPRGRGWENTISKYADGNPHEDAMRQYLIQSYQYGEKILKLYRIDKSISLAIKAALRQAELPASTFLDAYPNLVEVDLLPDLATIPTLANVSFEPDGSVSATFCSVRMSSVREEIQPDELPDEADDLKRFDEIFGIRHIRWQAMDVVRISPDGDFLEVLVDFPQGMTSAVAEVAHERVRTAFARVCGIGRIGDPVNLLPLINSIYSAHGEGAVVELAFGTTTASLKHEKMRRRRECLREETYHRGGKEALASDIEIHKLSVVWLLNAGTSNTRPELTLNCSSRGLGGAAPVVSSAVIRNCVDETDYEHLKGRMLHYLSLSTEPQE